MAANLEQDKLKFEFPPRLKQISLALIAVGLILTVAQVFVPWHGHGEHVPGHNPRLFLSILMAVLVFLPLAVGGIYFTALHHASGAAWSVTVRRIAESYFWFLPVILLALIAVFFGLGDAYHHWVGKAGEDKLIEWKAPYLDQTFFIVRNLVIVGLWIFFGLLFWKKSIAQDNDGQVSHTKSMIKWSTGFLVLFGLTFSISSWDLTMSLEPHWFSTMWAVYIFAGLALTTFASLILWVNYLKGRGLLGDAVNENHIHDLGKYLWGHTIFWAYIGICQYLLIWYAHIPEETYFYNNRLFTDEMGFNAWSWVSLGLLVLRFFIPFFALLKRENKRNIKFLSVIAWIVILGQIVDMYWVAYPSLDVVGDTAHFVMFSWHELGPLLVLGGAFIFVVGSALSRANLVPVKDPKLEECLHMHH